MAQSVQVQSFKSGAVPTQHHVEFDNALAACPDSKTEGSVISVLQQLIAMLGAFGKTVNWPCVFKSMSLLFAGNVVGFLAAYAACAAGTP